MTLSEMRDRVSDIERTSLWEATNFRSKKRPSKKRALKALKQDRNWLVDHADMCCRMYDRLIGELELEGE